MRLERLGRRRSPGSFGRRARWVGLVGAFLVTLVAGHVRLRNPATGAQLAWATPSVPIVIQANGSDDIFDGSDATAIRLALQDWNNVDGSALVLVEDTDPSERARMDWESSKLHTILFDEDGSTGFFGGGGLVAITPVRYLSNGRIKDADVLFNGLDHSFSTQGDFGSFDVQAIAAHELGHVVGLDHSAWSDSVLFPYVEPNDHLARALSQDERSALRGVYADQTFGTISGSVARSADATPVAGAHIVALDDGGRPAASVLCGPQGKFVLRGLEGGRYWLNVLPLEGAVSSMNLSGGQVIDTDFAALVGAGPIDLDPAGSSAAGQLFVDPEGALVFGRNTDSVPLRLVPGTTAGATLHGSGLVAGSVLEASDPDLSVQDVTWNGASVVFRVAVPVGEELGPVDLIVRTPDGEASVLTAALEITPGNPTVTSVQPQGASTLGGTDLVITGSGFRSGCRVVIGNRIYREGTSGGCALLSDGSLSLSLSATDEGLHDIVVLDRSGVEGRLEQALLVDQRPVVSTVFPSAGQSQGGTLVRATGSGFGTDTRVLMDGVEQPGVVVFDSTRLEFTTSGGNLGTHGLAFVNAAGDGDQASFDLTGSADPVLLFLEPDQGQRSGGESIDLTGANLDPACRVVFGVDPNTGMGGSEASIVEASDETSLRIITPGFAQTGQVAVAIQDPATGQATILSGAFFVQGKPGGSGGACASLSAPSSDLRGNLESASWMLLLLFLVTANAEIKRRRLQPRLHSRGPV